MVGWVHKVNWKGPITKGPLVLWNQLTLFHKLVALIYNYSPKDQAS